MPVDSNICARSSPLANGSSHDGGGYPATSAHDSRLHTNDHARGHISRVSSRAGGQVGQKTTLHTCRKSRLDNSSTTQNRTEALLFPWNRSLAPVPKHCIVVHSNHNGLSSGGSSGVKSSRFAGITRVMICPPTPSHQAGATAPAPAPLTPLAPPTPPTLSLSAPPEARRSMFCAQSMARSAERSCESSCGKKAAWYCGPQSFPCLLPHRTRRGARPSHDKGETRSQ